MPSPTHSVCAGPLYDRCYPWLFAFHPHLTYFDCINSIYCTVCRRWSRSFRLHALCGPPPLERDVYSDRS